MKNSIFNYCLSYFPVDTIYIMSLLNKKLRSKILSFWVKYDHFNFIEIMKFAFVKKYGVDNEFIKQDIFSTCGNSIIDQVSRYRMFYEISCEFEIEPNDVYYRPLFSIWKNLTINEAKNKKHIGNFIWANFLYRFKKRKLLKYILLNMDSYRMIIINHAISFGLVEFGKFITCPYSRLYCSPCNIEAYKYFKENNQELKVQQIFEEEQTDFNYILFLKQEYGRLYNRSKLFVVSVKYDNRKIARYIIQTIKPTKRTVFILSLKSITCIRYYYRLGYKFSHSDLSHVLGTQHKQLRLYCLKTYKHDLFSEN